MLAPLSRRIVAGLGGRVDRPHRCAQRDDRRRRAVVRAFRLRAQAIAGTARPTYDGSVYTWLVSDGIRMEVGFLIDRLTALMMVVVTFVSLCVHVYTIGYMHDDPGLSALLLVHLAVHVLDADAGDGEQLPAACSSAGRRSGVVSYLLIGFWYTRRRRSSRT